MIFEVYASEGVGERAGAWGEMEQWCRRGPLAAMVTHCADDQLFDGEKILALPLISTTMLCN